MPLATYRFTDGVWAEVFGAVTVEPETPVDSTPPTKPGVPQITSLSTTAVTFTWPASTDNVAVVKYKIYLNGSVIDANFTGSSLIKTRTGLTQDTDYTIEVTAVDAAGNESLPSALAFRTLPAVDTTNYTITLVDDDTDQAAAWASQMLTIPNGPSALNPTRVRLTTTNGGPARVDGRLDVIGKSNIIFDGEGLFTAYAVLSGIDAHITATTSCTLWGAAATVNNVVHGADTVYKGSHGYSNGARIAFATINAVTGLSVRTFYYVVSATANDFKLSLTQGGAAIDFTGTNVSAAIETTSNRQHFRILQSANVEIWGVRMIGPYAGRFYPESNRNDHARWVVATAFEHAFMIGNSSTDCAFRRCYAEWCGGDGIIVTGATSGQVPPLRSTFEDITIWYQGRQAIAMVHCDGVTIRRFVSHLGARSGFDFEPLGSGQYTHNVLLEDATVGSLFNPVTISGLNKDRDDELPAGVGTRRKGITIRRVTGIEHGSSATPVLLSNGGEDILIEDLTDLAPGTSGFGIRANGYSNVVVRRANLRYGPSTPVTFGVGFQIGSGEYGPWTVEDSNFNRDPASTQPGNEADVLTLITGPPSTFTADAASDQLLLSGHNYANDEYVFCWNTSPTNIGSPDGGERYYVVNATGSSIQLSLTLGGAPVSITTNGTAILAHILTDPAGYTHSGNTWARNTQGD